jgi:lanosterol synthase
VGYRFHRLSYCRVWTCCSEEPNLTSCVKALEWLDQAQIKGNHHALWKGFQASEQGCLALQYPRRSYTVSDCTAEGLKAVLYL